MKVFDTDIVSLYFQGHPGYVTRFLEIDMLAFWCTIVTVEESLDGRLGYIREMQSQNRAEKLETAYEYLEKTLVQLRNFEYLQYGVRAHEIFRENRSNGIRIGTRDLRIAAICVAHDASLVTRNRRDFERVPGLKLEIWA